MRDVTFSGKTIEEVLEQIQNHLNRHGMTMLTRNIYLLPEELATRWRVHESHLGNLRVSGKGPAFMKLSNGKYAKVRYPLFGEGGVLAHERDMQKNSTME